ncbi:MAG: glycosyltransferase [Phycisphaerae bacterium]
MRLGLYHGPLHRQARGYDTYGPYARYIAEFARHSEEVVVFAPISRSETDYSGCAIDAPNVRVVELPYFSTHIQAGLHLTSISAAFLREIKNLDVVNCRNTAPYGYLLYFFGRPRNLRFFYHFTSDPQEIITVGPKYRGSFGRFAARAYGLDFRIQRHVMKRTYSFVNGKLPYERLRRITDRMEPIISSALLQSDFFKRADFTLHKPPRLLYVGYLKHMKGLSHLLDAVRILRNRGQTVELHLVGTGPESHALRRQADDLALAGQVHFHGYVPMGPQLNGHYDRADIFVFPSLSEGSPRAVLEALAHSLPVVSTPVGSVPDLITDGQGGLLVPRHDANAMAEAVLRFLGDDGLRRRCATTGYASATKHTVEHFVRPMVARAREYCDGRQR